MDARPGGGPRSASAQLLRLRSLADELVALQVDMIVTYGTEATAAAKSATMSIPTVMASSGDPVGMGLVADMGASWRQCHGYSLVQPEIARKRAALLHELLPRGRRVWVLVNSVHSDPCAHRSPAALPTARDGQ